MEFSSRGFQRESARPTNQGTVPSSTSPNNKTNPSGKKTLHKLKNARPTSVLGVIFFISVLVLIIAVLLGISTKSSENAMVDEDRYQAVFLNGGQAYFGKISNLNDRYVDLSDIYYISTQNGQGNDASQANISLVKLGSELHCPQDRMVINREQVLFWENIKDDGKVVKAIKQWKEENPDGQKCNDSTTQQQTTSQSQSNTNTENNDAAAADNATQNPTTPPTSTDNGSNDAATPPDTGSDNTGSPRSTTP